MKTKLRCFSREEYLKYAALMQKHPVISENYMIVFNDNDIANEIDRVVRDRIDHTINLIPEALQSKYHKMGIIEREGIK